MDNRHSELVFAISKVSEGNMSYRWGDKAEVRQSRERFCNKMGITIDDVSSVSLEHGSKIVRIDEGNAGLGMDQENASHFEADGLITLSSGIGLMLVVADCIPAVFYEPKNHLLVLVHAGRMGVELNIAKQAIIEMKKLGNIDIEDIMVLAGPAISAKSYVFDSPQGVDMDFWADDFVIGDDGKYHMDIKSKFESQLLAAGVATQNIDISPIDTYTDTNYYSHRRSTAINEKEGRFAALAYIKP